MLNLNVNLERTHSLLSEVTSKAKTGNKYKTLYETRDRTMQIKKMYQIAKQKLNNVLDIQHAAKRVRRNLSTHRWKNTTVMDVLKCYNCMCGARRRAGGVRALLLFLVSCILLA